MDGEVKRGRKEKKEDEWQRGKERGCEVSKESEESRSAFREMTERRVNTGRREREK